MADRMSLSADDHDLLDRFIGELLDRYKAGTIERHEAVDHVGQVIESMTTAGGFDWRKYMERVLSQDDS
jgi:hypothetical protein